MSDVINHPAPPQGPQSMPITPDELNLLMERRKRMEAAPPPPIYPNLTLPESPAVAHNKQGPLVGGEGFIEPLLDPLTSNVLPPKEGKPRILIGIPMLSVSFEFLESFLKFWTDLLSKGDKYEIGYFFAYRRPVHMAEEAIVKAAQYNKCTHVLFMDDDIYDTSAEDLDKLLAADKDVIGGVMHASKFPHAMCVFRRFDTSKKVIDMPADTSMYRLYEVPCLCTQCKAPQSHWDGKHCSACGAKQDNLIQQADLIPFPFTLMKMSVFDKIKTPWFHCTAGYPTDSWFADRLIEVGMTEYAHMGVRLNHAGVTDETKPLYAQMGMAKAQKANAIVNITPEQMQIHQNLLVNKMKETEDRMQPKPPFFNDGKIAVNSIEPKTERLTLVTHGGDAGK